MDKLKDRLRKGLDLERRIRVLLRLHLDLVEDLGSLQLSSRMEISRDRIRLNQNPQGQTQNLQGQTQTTQNGFGFKQNQLGQNLQGQTQTTQNQGFKFGSKQESQNQTESEPTGTTAKW